MIFIMLVFSNFLLIDCIAYHQESCLLIFNTHATCHYALCSFAVLYFISFCFRWNI